jgi:hypothetical protein
VRVDLNRYCVYTHSVDGEVFYIGKGVASRPFCTDGRNSCWYAIVSKAKGFDVDILRWFDTNDEACRWERRMIEEYKPVANLKCLRKFEKTKH